MFRNKKVQIKLDGELTLELGEYEILGKKEKRFKCTYNSVISYAGTPEDAIDKALSLYHHELKKFEDKTYNEDGTLKTTKWSF